MGSQLDVVAVGRDVYRRCWWWVGENKPGGRGDWYPELEWLGVFATTELANEFVRRCNEQQHTDPSPAP